MDSYIRNKRIIIVASVIFLICSIAAIIYFLISKTPSTQASSDTVIIDNYSKYTAHISSDSFGYLGNYLYSFIDNPSNKVYHASIVDDSYSYASDSWFSKFTVRLNESDISWNISLQTIKNGDINGDINITCVSGSACLSFSSKVVDTPLAAYLPLNSADYIIANKTGDADTLSIIYYDKAGTGKTKALEKIKSLGFNPEDYTIKYYYGGR